MKLSKNTKTLRVGFTGLTTLVSNFNYAVSFDNLPAGADVSKMPRVRFCHSKNEAGVLLDLSGSQSIPTGCRWYSFAFDIDERELITGAKVIPQDWDGLITITILPDPITFGHLPDSIFEYKLSFIDNKMNVAPNQIITTPSNDNPYTVGAPPERQALYFNLKFQRALEADYHIWITSFGGLSTTDTAARDLKMYTHFLPINDGVSAPMSGYFPTGAFLRYRLNNDPTWITTAEKVIDKFVLPQGTTHFALDSGDVNTKSVVDANINYAKAYGFIDAERLFGVLRLTTARIHPTIPGRFIPSKMKVEPYYTSNYLVRTL